MEPHLVSRLHGYTKLKLGGKIKKDYNFNDSNVSYSDLRCNDLWMMAYFILISFNADFAKCYSYHKDNNARPIKFDVKQFLELYKGFCQRFETDTHLIHVLNEMLGMNRFCEGNGL